MIFKGILTTMLALITSAATLLRAVIALQAAISIVIVKALGFGFSWPGFIAAVLIFFFLKIVLVSIQFGLSWVWGSPTPEGSKINFFGKVSTFWGEITASLSAFLWRMPFRPHTLMIQPNINQQARSVSVLLIHGYGCNRAMWLKFSRGLAAQGYCSDAINLEPPLGSIDQYCNVIEAGVSELIKRTGTDRVAIVAHSMGGLAARAFLKNSTPIQNQRIARVISLGTPHLGTVHALLGHGENSRQMRPKSLWRSALANSERPTDLSKFTCIFTHQDNIVAPQANQTVPGAKNIELSAIGHVALAYSPIVLNLVISELNAI
jgi:triacylglycerol esterase/lipase EstA (alpha/beta hydrolase family)